MEETFERTKKVLNKNFCLMRWQRIDAENRGEEVMEAEDIEFLLSLKGIKKEDVMHFGEVKDLYSGIYDSEKFYIALYEAKEKNLLGVTLYTCLTKEDNAKVTEMVILSFTQVMAHRCGRSVFHRRSLVASARIQFSKLFGGIRGFVKEGIL